jgi:hypothetical protein
MNSFPNSVAEDMHRLGILAMNFRSTRDEAVRREIA